MPTVDKCVDNVAFFVYNKIMDPVEIKNQSEYEKLRPKIQKMNIYYSVDYV